MATTTTQAQTLEDELCGAPRMYESPLSCFVVRLVPGDKLVAALAGYVSQLGLRAPFILTCVGSARRATIRLAHATATDSNKVLNPHRYHRIEDYRSMYTLERLWGLFIVEMEGGAGGSAGTRSPQFLFKSCSYSYLFIGDGRSSRGYVFFVAVARKEPGSPARPPPPPHPKTHTPP